MLNNFFYGYRTVYEIMWNITVESDRPETTIWRMYIAWWTPKATETQNV